MDTTENLINRLEACEWADEALRAALELKGEAQQALFALARRRRQEHFPDNKAQARSVIEISNVCRQ